MRTIRMALWSLLIGLGVVVLLLALGIFLPMWDLTKLTTQVP